MPVPFRNAERRLEGSNPYDPKIITVFKTDKHANLASLHADRLGAVAPPGPRECYSRQIHHPLAGKPHVGIEPTSPVYKTGASPFRRIGRVIRVVSQGFEPRTHGM
jgi:hypothetical protein